MPTNVLDHVKFTKIYTDGHQEETEIEDDTRALLLTCNLVLPSAEKLELIDECNYTDGKLFKDVCIYTPIVHTGDFCLHFIRHEYYLGYDKLKTVNTDYILKVEWAR